jgi:hypothetical protein
MQIVEMADPGRGESTAAGWCGRAGAGGGGPLGSFPARKNHFSFKPCAFWSYVVNAILVPFLPPETCDDDMMTQLQFELNSITLPSIASVGRVTTARAQPLPPALDPERSTASLLTVWRASPGRTLLSAVSRAFARSYYPLALLKVLTYLSYIVLFMSSPG